MQTARLFLIPPPSPWLSNVLCHVFADLRFNGKIGPRSLNSTHLLTKKMGLQTAAQLPYHPFLLASEALPLPSLSPISHSAP
jgi:hypothetical protein